MDGLKFKWPEVMWVAFKQFQPQFEIPCELVDQVGAQGGPAPGLNYYFLISLVSLTQITIIQPKRLIKTIKIFTMMIAF